jgi:hypothetical protein
MCSNTMPVLSPSAMRWFDFAQCAALAGLTALLALRSDGVDRLATKCWGLLGAVSIVIGSMWLLRLWARWHGRPTTSGAARAHALKAVPVSFIRSTMLALAIVQLEAGEPAWLLGLRGWMVTGLVTRPAWLDGDRRFRSHIRADWHLHRPSQCQGLERHASFVCAKAPLAYDFERIVW